MVREQADASLAAIGAGRLDWLKQLPERWSAHGVAVVHATPGDLWRAPMPNATDEELLAAYSTVEASCVVYGHVHVPFVRRLAALTVANSGSVGLPYDGDPRAAYLLIDGTDISVRRVEYDVEAEIAELNEHHLPHTAWVASMLRAGKYIPPP